MEAVLLIGRILFSALFIMNGINHLRNADAVGQYAASAGVGGGAALSIVTGLMILVGGLMVLLGFKGRIGAVLIVLFLIPVTFLMHKFWAIPDAMMAVNQQAHFMKNIALAGAALMITYFGTGPYSLRP